MKVRFWRCSPLPKTFQGRAALRLTADFVINVCRCADPGIAGGGECGSLKVNAAA